MVTYPSDWTESKLLDHVDLVQGLTYTPENVKPHGTLVLRSSNIQDGHLALEAKQCGLTKRAYLVHLLEGNPVRVRPSQEIKDLRTEVHRVGNNINQIARSVNAGIAKAEDAKRGLCLLKQVYELMYRIANK